MSANTSVQTRPTPTLVAVSPDEPTAVAALPTRNEVRRLFKDEEYEQLAERLQKAAADGGEAPVYLRYYGGTAMAKLGQHRQALHHLQSVLNDDPDHLAVRVAIANLYLERDEFDRAQEAIDGLPATYRGTRTLRAQLNARRHAAGEQVVPLVPSTVQPKTEASKPLPNPPIYSKQRRAKRGLGLVTFLFLALVVAPTAAAIWYYATTASDQFQSRTRFAVRGTQESPLSNLGLTALPGSGNQASDAYIVTEYLQSEQLVTDLAREGVDLREYFARDFVDPLYRIEPDMPLEKFISYWHWMIDAEYNSTTSITTFQVNAFTAEDAQTIAETVLRAAEVLVNDLSSKARQQLIATAETEVQRTEADLRAARERLTDFRNREQSLDPKAQASTNEALVQVLRKELIDLQARRAALLSTVRADSPSVRIIDRQIAAATAQLEEQRQAVGSGEGTAPAAADDGDRNLSEVLGDYTQLTLEEEFAQNAYTAALSSLETAKAEARKQERYFAIVVAPTLPSVALYPQSIVNVILIFGVCLLVWLFVHLVVQSMRDHAV